MSDAICPRCQREVSTHRCHLCGSVRTVNAVSGNVVWMLNGRVVEAFHDERSAYIQVAQRCGIPVSEWPKRFSKES